MHTFTLPKFKIGKDFSKKEIVELKKPIPIGWYHEVNKHNESSQATRVKNIGQMSEIVPNFLAMNPDATHEDWEIYYNKLYPGRFEECFNIFKNYVHDRWDEYGLIYGSKADGLLYDWFHNFIFISTFYGLAYQDSVLSAVARRKGKEYKKATPSDESKNIDAYIDGEPYSVKPVSWKEHSKLTDMKIDNSIKMIYYELKKTEVVIEYED